MLSIALFVVRYPERFGLEADSNSQPENYTIQKTANSSAKVPKPILPNLDGYTLEAIQGKIPPLSEGAITVQKLEEGYSFVRSQTAFYGDLQERLDPLAIVVRDGIVSLNNIVEAVADETLIRQESDGRFLLYVPLVVRENGGLVIDQGQTLLMSANHGAMLPVYGNLYIVNAYVMGWDMQQDQPAYYQSENDFRPYIVAWCSSRLDIVKSYLGYLGYNAPKSYGVTYSSCKNDKYVEKGTPLTSGTGWLVDNEFEQLYFGFYSYETDSAAIIDNIYKDSIVYGIDPHDYSKNLIIANNKVTGTREKHGIIVSRGVSDSYILDNISAGNAGTGIMLDRDSQKNIIANNQSFENAGDGMAVYESPHNILYANSLSNNEGVGLRIRNSWDVKSIKDRMNNNGGVGITLYTQELNNRDLERDPYEQKAHAFLSETELSGNEAGVFNLADFDTLEIYNPRIFEVKKSIFNGDLKALEMPIISPTESYIIESR